MQKKIRAISSDLVYQGRAIRGRQRTRVDGSHGSYEVFVTEGEEFECGQVFAKEAIERGAAILISGGSVDVTPMADGFPIYESWIRNPADPAPVFEPCELLRPLSFGDECILPAGSKIRLDISTTPRTGIQYEDDEQNDSHSIRVFKISPRKVRISQAETAGKVNAIFEKLFPATA